MDEINDLILSQRYRSGAVPTSGPFGLEMRLDAPSTYQAYWRYSPS